MGKINLKHIFLIILAFIFFAFVPAGAEDENNNTIELNSVELSNQEGKGIVVTVDSDKKFPSPPLLFEKTKNTYYISLPATRYNGDKDVDVSGVSDKIKSATINFIPYKSSKNSGYTRIVIVTKETIPIVVKEKSSEIPLQTIIIISVVFLLITLTIAYLVFALYSRVKKKKRVDLALEEYQYTDDAAELPATTDEEEPYNNQEETSEPQHNDEQLESMTFEDIEAKIETEKEEILADIFNDSTQSETENPQEDIPASEQKIDTETDIDVNQISDSEIYYWDSHGEETAQENDEIQPAQEDNEQVENIESIDTIPEFTQEDTTEELPQEPIIQEDNEQIENIESIDTIPEFTQEDTTEEFPQEPIIQEDNEQIDNIEAIDTIPEFMEETDEKEPPVDNLWDNIMEEQQETPSQLVPTADEIVSDILENENVIDEISETIINDNETVSEMNTSEFLADSTPINETEGTVPFTESLNTAETEPMSPPSNTDNILETSDIDLNINENNNLTENLHFETVESDDMLDEILDDIQDEITQGIETPATNFDDIISGKAITASSEIPADTPDITEETQNDETQQDNDYTLAEMQHISGGGTISGKTFDFTAATNNANNEAEKVEDTTPSEQEEVSPFEEYGFEGMLAGEELLDNYATQSADEISTNAENDIENTIEPDIEDIDLNSLAADYSETTGEDTPTTEAIVSQEISQETEPVETPEEVQETSQEIEPIETAEEIQETLQEAEPFEMIEEIQETLQETEPVETTEEVQGTSQEIEPFEMIEEIQETLQETEPVETTEEVQGTSQEVEPVEMPEEIQETPQETESLDKIEEVQEVLPVEEKKEVISVNYSEQKISQETDNTPITKEEILAAHIFAPKPEYLYKSEEYFVKPDDIQTSDDTTNSFFSEANETDTEPQSMDEYFVEEIEPEEALPETDTTTVVSPVQTDNEPVVLDKKDFSQNKSIYLLRHNDEYSLVATIGENVFVIEKFEDAPTSNKILLKHNEKRANDDIYIAKVGSWRALISVSKDNIKNILTL